MQSPLVEVGLSYILSFRSSTPQVVLTHLKSFLEKYISKQISYDECEREFLNTLGTTSPLEKVADILNISSDPLPSTEENNHESNSKRKKTRPWTHYEDQRLLAAIHKFGNQNWARIAKFVGNNRTRSQAAQRWSRGLNPKISKDHWNRDEDLKLLRLVNMNRGKGWTTIANGMGNRSDVQCRYHYTQLQKDLTKPNNIKNFGNIFASLSAGNVFTPQVYPPGMGVVPGQHFYPQGMMNKPGGTRSSQVVVPKNYVGKIEDNMFVANPVGANVKSSVSNTTRSAPIQQSSEQPAQASKMGDENTEYGRGGVLDITDDIKIDFIDLCEMHDVYD